MTAIFTPSTGAVRRGARVDSDPNRLRPGQRVLFRESEESDFEVGTIDEHVGASGLYFLVSNRCIPTALIEGRTPEDFPRWCERTMITDYRAAIRSEDPDAGRERLRRIHRLW